MQLWKASDDRLPICWMALYATPFLANQVAAPILPKECDLKPVASMWVDLIVFVSTAPNWYLVKDDLPLCRKCGTEDESAGK